MSDRREEGRGDGEEEERGDGEEEEGGEGEAFCECRRDVSLFIHALVVCL